MYHNKLKNTNSSYLTGIGILIGILLSMSSSSLMAQQTAFYNHYAYSQQLYNPAFVGSQRSLTAASLFRWQWVGIDGSPQAQTLLVNTPVKKNLGVGFSILNDQAGVLRQVLTFLDIAYHIPINKTSKIGIGVKGGLNFISANLVDVQNIDPDDPAFVENQSNTLPNLGFGLFYSSKHIYAGLSTPKMIENTFFNSINLGSEATAYYFQLGGNFELNREFQMKPSVIGAFVEGSPISVESTLLVEYVETIAVGAFFRYEGSIGSMLQYKPNEQLVVGYAYSHNTDLPNIVSSSHELLLAYVFDYSEKRIKNPRFVSGRR